jgi:hypothetical protein
MAQAPVSVPAPDTKVRLAADAGEDATPSAITPAANEKRLFIITISFRQKRAIPLAKEFIRMASDCYMNLMNSEVHWPRFDFRLGYSRSE